MPKIEYVARDFSARSLERIEQANEIITEYEAQGFKLTLRQLYYQFVARDLIPNKQREYKNLGSLINDARLAGLVDWDAIEDRTRNVRKNAHWSSPSDIVEACAQQFRIDLWKTQPYRVEVWIEKDALVGVVERACTELDIPYFACRGYTSQSEQWAAGQRFIQAEKRGQRTVVLHLGDHDPSGIDMTRDNANRLLIFGSRVIVERVALNMDQIEEHNPPPNPAKATDSRFLDYEAKHGDESWELDALSPKIIDGLVRSHAKRYIDQDAWAKARAEQAEHRKALALVAADWNDVVARLQDEQDE